MDTAGDAPAASNVGSCPRAREFGAGWLALAAHGRRAVVGYCLHPSLRGPRSAMSLGKECRAGERYSAWRNCPAVIQIQPVRITTTGPSQRMLIGQPPPFIKPRVRIHRTRTRPWDCTAGLPQGQPKRHATRTAGRTVRCTIKERTRAAHLY